MLGRVTRGDKTILIAVDAKFWIPSAGINREKKLELKKKEASWNEKAKEIAQYYKEDIIYMVINAMPQKKNRLLGYEEMIVQNIPDEHRIRRIMVPQIFNQDVIVLDEVLQKINEQINIFMAEERGTDYDGEE